MIKLGRPRETFLRHSLQREKESKWVKEKVSVVTMRYMCHNRTLPLSCFCEGCFVSTVCGTILLLFLPTCPFSFLFAFQHFASLFPVHLHVYFRPTFSFPLSSCIFCCVPCLSSSLLSFPDSQCFGCNTEKKDVVHTDDVLYLATEDICHLNNISFLSLKALSSLKSGHPPLSFPLPLSF